jgi:leucyl aminopeptidase (aminopeptidase T)
MSEIRELIDTELDAVCGGHHGHHGHDFNFGNIVIQENIVEQIGVAIGNNASVTNLVGSQTNLSSIAGNIGDSNFGNIGDFNIVNFGNIVIQENIVEQIGVAIGDHASVTNLLGSQTNFSSIGSDPLSHPVASDPLSHPAALQAPPSGAPLGLPPH